MATSEDPQHCGACGHDGAGGECEAGVCSAMVVATRQSEPDAIAVDATDVYATDQPAPTGVAIDASCVYWVNGGDGTVMKRAK